MLLTVLFEGKIYKLINCFTHTFSYSTKTTSSRAVVDLWDRRPFCRSCSRKAGLYSWLLSESFLDLHLHKMIVTIHKIMKAPKSNDETTIAVVVSIAILNWYRSRWLFFDVKILFHASMETWTVEMNEIWIFYAF